MGNLISVIIPSYNSFKTIQFTLDHLLAQQGDYIAEIIVVDSSDDQKTRDLLKAYKNSVVLKYLDTKAIPATGRNIGAKLAKGTILAFIDSDAYPSPDWSKCIVDTYHEGGMVGGGSYTIPSFQRKSPLALAQYFIQFSEFLRRGGKKVKQFVPSCNLFCDKKIFLESEGFPEIRAMEDVKFGCKISRKYTLIFNPDIVVSHIFRQDITLYLSNQFMLGKYNGISRYGHNKNSVIKTLLFYILFPFFFIMKITLIACRVIRYIDSDLFLFFISLPVIMLGVICWTMGFVSSVKSCAESGG